jgi:CHAD domain-containing protein
VNPTFPPKLAAHLAESVCDSRRRYRKCLARCQKKFSQKAVHNLRIETRRILALLDLLLALRFEGPLKKLRKTFKKRLDAFDDLRDTHVQWGLLRPMWPDFPEASRLKKHLRKCEKRLVAKLSGKIQTIKNGKLNRQLKEIQESLVECADHPVTARGPILAQTLLRGAYREVIAFRREIRRNDPTTIHRMRVAFKRFRYTAELLQPFLPHFNPERLARMKEFQSAAGNVQDVAVLLTRLDNDVQHKKLEASCVKNLRVELLQHERRAIDSFMNRINDLMDFEPPVSFEPQPEPVSK